MAALETVPAPMRPPYLTHSVRAPSLASETADCHRSKSNMSDAGEEEISSSGAFLRGRLTCRLLHFYPPRSQVTFIFLLECSCGSTWFLNHVKSNNIN